MSYIEKIPPAVCWLVGTLIVIGILLSLAPAVRAEPLILQPGESLDNIVLEEIVVNEDSSAGSGIAATGDVTLGPADDNQVQLSAQASTCTLDRKVLGDCSTVGRHTALARAHLFVNFCVPEAGQVDCAGTPSGVAEDVTATVSLDILSIGQLSTLPITGVASFGITARVLDLVRNKTVGFQTVESESLSGGKIKKIARVPVPIPNFENEEIKPKTVFTVQLRRGHPHRFSVFAAAKADSGRQGSAFANFQDQVENVLSGRVEVQNLSIDVSPAGIDPISNLKARIQALEELLAELGLQLNGLAEAQDEMFGGLQQEASDLGNELYDLDQITQDVQSKLDTLTLNFNGHMHYCRLLINFDRRNRPKLLIVCDPPTISGQ